MVTNTNYQYHLESVNKPVIDRIEFYFQSSKLYQILKIYNYWNLKDFSRYLSSLETFPNLCVETRNIKDNYYMLVINEIEFLIHSEDNIVFDFSPNTFSISIHNQAWMENHYKKAYYRIRGNYQEYNELKDFCASHEESKFFLYYLYPFPMSEDTGEDIDIMLIPINDYEKLIKVFTKPLAVDLQLYNSYGKEI